MLRIYNNINICFGICSITFILRIKSDMYFTYIAKEKKNRFPSTGKKIESFLSAIYHIKEACDD